MVSLLLLRVVMREGGERCFSDGEDQGGCSFLEGETSEV